MTCDLKSQEFLELVEQGESGSGKRKKLTVVACRWYTLLDSLPRLPLLNWELPFKATEALVFWLQH